jgi:hypothetical protein
MVAQAATGPPDTPALTGRYARTATILPGARPGRLPFPQRRAAGGRVSHLRAIEQRAQSPPLADLHLQQHRQPSLISMCARGLRIDWYNI